MDGWTDLNIGMKSIVYKHVSGKGKVNTNVIDCWKNVIPKIFKVFIRYGICNVIKFAQSCNIMNEGVINHTFILKRKEYTGGQFRKDRLLGRINAEGTKKIKFFVIGKSQNPHCYI